ncbi:MAG: hypothetical protein ACFFCW_23995 [Candidatus Hodarchaeota archaeon]
MQDRLKSFVGKLVDVNKAKTNGFEYDDTENGKPVLEKYLSEFEMTGVYDKDGFNGYSIELRLKGDKIVSIRRIAHCHMCGGQGVDRMKRKFPQASLEEEAYEEIQNILS